jgi:hypothetical protein
VGVLITLVDTTQCVDVFGGDTRRSMCRSHVAGQRRRQQRSSSSTSCVYIDSTLAHSLGRGSRACMQNASRKVERKYQAWSNGVRLRIAAACSAGLHRRNRISSGTRTIPPGKAAAVRQRGPHEWASLRSAFHFARLDTGRRICSNLLSRTVRRHATSQSSGLLRSAIGLIKAEQVPS